MILFYSLYNNIKAINSQTIMKHEKNNETHFHVNSTTASLPSHFLNIIIYLDKNFLLMEWKAFYESRKTKLKWPTIF